MQSSVLVLVGSFYPLHDGHLDIMLTAKNSIDKVGPPVVECRLVPTHAAALRRKFPGLPPPRQFQDDRADLARPVIARRHREFSGARLVWDERLVAAPRRGACAAPRPRYQTAASAVSDLRVECAESGGAVVQVFGADSLALADRVFSVAPIESPDLPSVVVVSDGRAVGAAEAAAASVPVIFDANPRHPPVSSTILRRRSPERYHPASFV